MKYFTFLILVSCFVACKKESFSNENEFNASLQKWNSYKINNLYNNYSYVAYSASVFGFASETQITVKGGQVISRTYKLTQAKRTATDTVKVLETWTEDEHTMNTHTNGALPLTIDELYEKARKEWLNVNKSQNDIEFQTDANGIIAVCGYTPKNCVDDCFTGISIKDLSGMVIN